MVAPGPPSRFALVADDDALIRRVIGMALESDGWTVLQAADAPATIDLLDRYEIALCVMDRHMPGAPLEARLEIIRRLHPDAAIVVLSGDSAELPLGSDSIVSLGKPIGVDELHDGVSQAVARANRSPGVASA